MFDDWHSEFQEKNNILFTVYVLKSIYVYFYTNHKYPRIMLSEILIKIHTNRRRLWLYLFSGDWN